MARAQASLPEQLPARAGLGTTARPGRRSAARRASFAARPAATARADRLGRRVLVRASPGRLRGPAPALTRPQYRSSRWPISPEAPVPGPRARDQRWADPRLAGTTP